MTREEALRAQLHVLAQAYQRQAEPLIKELAAIEARKPVRFIPPILTTEQAEALIRLSGVPR